MNKVIRNLKLYRKAKGLTQGELAKKTKLGLHTISRIENGQVTGLHKRTVKILREFFKDEKRARKSRTETPKKKHSESYLAQIRKTSGLNQKQMAERTGSSDWFISHLENDTDYAKSKIGTDLYKNIMDEYAKLELEITNPIDQKVAESETNLNLTLDNVGRALQKKTDNVNFCSHCGIPVGKEAKFCSSCGNKLR